MNSKISRMKELIEILNNASYQYYQLSNPVMTDYEYDKLYDELTLLEKETNTVLSNSPTINIETGVSKSLEKVEHSEPMLSLSKTKMVDDLKDFLKDKDGVLSWKLDGLTIVLTYRNGKLYSGVTRGNGIVGEVVTENVKQFKNVPYTIPFTGELIVRGEAIIKYSDFIKMNGEINDDSQFKNPRNLCSGSVRQLDSSITAKRNVNCIVFALIKSEGKSFSSRIDAFNWLESLGFECVERYLVNSNNIENKVLSFKEKIKDYDIPSDGLVLSYDDIKYGESLGSTAKAPKHSIAFKWMDETERTKLKFVDWSTSRTGLINPVAVFDPVELEGTIVSRASLHNLSIMDNLKLGIGDEIEVYKANMIIPQVANNLTKSDNIQIPKRCPVCGEKTEIIVNNNVKYLYCTNDFCHAKFIKKLSLFVERNAMNIDGISESILSRLFYEGLLNDYADLYHLDNYKDIIMNYEGFGEKSYNNMMDSINKSRNVKLPNFIYALGIPEIGYSRAKLICKMVNYDFNKLRNIGFNELSSIDGIGDIIAQKWVETFENKEFNNSINNLLKEIKFIDSKDSSEKLDGKIFVITGSLEKFNNRDELIDLIEQNGGKVVSSISKNVSYLINNDLTSQSTKNRKAQELGVAIIPEEDFLKMIN